MAKDPQQMHLEAESTRSQAVEQLRAAVERGMIRNADLEELKFHVGRAWYEDTRSLYEILGRPKHPHTEMDRIWYQILELSPYSLNHVKVIAKRLPGILKKVEAPDERISAAAEAVMEMHDRWLVLADLMAAVKPLIVKGRQPSETPADSRTLENTGTCSCCDRNIKLKDLQIVDHGFQVDGGRHGQCFGVNHYPIEVSSEGVSAMKISFEKQRENRKAHLESVEKDEVDYFIIGMYPNTKKIGRDEPKFERARLAAMETTRGEIAHLGRNIALCEQRIASWKPRLLPDGATHFALENVDLPSAPRP